MKDSILFTKSKAFALRVVRLYKYLREHKESVIAKRMLRAGTSIGANIAESRYAQSKADFASSPLASRRRKRTLKTLQSCHPAMQKTAFVL